MFKPMAQGTQQFAFIQLGFDRLEGLCLLSYCEILAAWVFVVEVVSNYPIRFIPAALTLTTKIFYRLPLNLSPSFSLIPTSTSLAEGVEIPPNLAFWTSLGSNIKMFGSEFLSTLCACFCFHALYE